MPSLDVEAGAHFIDSPYAFPHYTGTILQTQFTAQYTQTNMTCHFLYINIHLRHSYTFSHLSFNIKVKDGPKTK
jgi:hypothetical protein